MTNKPPRRRAHLLTGLGGGPAGPLRLSAEEKAGKQRLAEHLGSLKTALDRGDLPAARAARSAAWGEVDKLDPYITREERQELWKSKLVMRGIEGRPRRT